MFSLADASSSPTGSLEPCRRGRPRTGTRRRRPSERRRLCLGLPPRVRRGDRCVSPREGCPAARKLEARLGAVRKPPEAAKGVPAAEGPWRALRGLKRCRSLGARSRPRDARDRLSGRPSARETLSPAAAQPEAPSGRPLRETRAARPWGRRRRACRVAADACGALPRRSRWRRSRRS